MVAPINSNKHYVARTNVGIAAGAGLSVDVADAVVAPAAANAFDVRQGAVLKAVHLEYWIWNSSTTGVDTQFVLIVEKVPSGAGAATVSEMLNLGAYNNKKNVLFTTQGVLGAGIDGSPALPLIRDWVLIPKGKQRMGLGDKIVVGVTTVGGGLQLCGMALYKEYT